MHPKHLVAAAAAVAMAGTAFGSPAVADDPSPKPQVSVLDSGLVTPLSLAVSEDGTAYYSENFKGTLLRKKPGKAPTTLYQASEGTEVGAVSERLGSLRFAVTLPPAGEEEPPATALMGIGASGKAKPLANLSAFEENKNPDGNITYGFRSLPDDCEVPPFLQAYQGIVESHPYATTQAKGRTFIADAAGNSILKYGSGGRLSTVAVLPAQPLLVTEAVREALKDPETQEHLLPECAVGETVHLEAVPTDVELADGKLYVTTLPGGPESPALGPRASVYKIDPKTGKTKKVASGLMSATGVAVGGNGTLFVSELFGGRIAKVKAGSSTPTKYLNIPLPGDVELRSNGDLYATVKVLDEETGGEVIRVRR